MLPRFKDKDFVIQDELDVFKKEGVLTQHFGAFSHQTPGRFETADMLMAEEPKPVWDILKQPNAHYYYCGPAAFNIPAKLEAALLKACIDGGKGKVTMEHAEKIIAKMKGEKRWLVEAF
eukprot:m51a1_g1556 putative sulfite reductase (119) ;mRNA; r:19698-23927